ncbi:MULTISPECIES: hypothetical protein [Xanthobacter]|uniref:Capsule biosynthesis protein n=1 Tax=Xanthobacter aminoxidans TaxID=186280 RepID=A0ABW6ZEB2_9HYPH|nr:hypothetical protein [Xanthobacter sp. 91]
MSQPVSPTQNLSVRDELTESLVKRNARVREELRQRAREARRRQPVVRRADAGFWGIEALAAIPQRLPLWPSFIVLVLVPTLLASIYFVFIASRQYVSEARFAVRTSEHSGLEGIGGLSALQGLAEVQDSLIISNFVKSLAMVEALDEKVGLRQLLSKPDIDWFSRFNPSRPVERLERAWRAQMDTSIEGTSGIITVRVWAFSPEDTLRITRAIVSLSEDMVNKLGERTRKDAIAQNQAELERAQERLRKARAAMRDLRNEVGVIDPVRTNEGVDKLISELESDLTLVDQQIGTARRTLSPDAPQFTLLDARRQAIKDNITTLKARLTTRTGAAGDTLSAVMTRYDTLELERQIAERQYTTAAEALEQARVNAERRGMYLAAFVNPVLAQEADYPNRFWMPVAAAALFCVIWLVILAGFELARQLRS